MKQYDKQRLYTSFHNLVYEIENIPLLKKIIMYKELSDIVDKYEPQADKKR
jgi:hypothetical protein